MLIWQEELCMDRDWKEWKTMTTADSLQLQIKADGLIYS